MAAARNAIHARLTGSFLSAWLLFPAVLALTSIGCGLLVRCAAAGELSSVLIAPVGFALMIVICAFATSYAWLTAAGGPIVVVAAAAGYALYALGGRARRPKLRLSRTWLWPLLAAVAAFAAVGGPVFLTGSVGWTGYARLVDIAFQMDFAQHLADAGRVNPPNGSSSYNIVIAKLIAIGYPAGGQATLGEMANLVRTNLAWCYQAFLAFTAAMGAIAIFSTLGRVTRNGVLRAVAGAIAIQPNILYGYALEGGIKELTTTALLMLVVALAANRPASDGSPRGAVPLAVAAAAAFGSFSLGVAPWLGLLLVGLLAVSLARIRGHWRVLQNWAAFALVAAIISIPTLITAAKLASVAGAAVGGVVDLGLGNLAAPVSRWAAAGVYFTGDYRYPLVHATATHIFDIVVIALAAVGLLISLVRRQWTFVIVGLAAGGALYYFIHHSTAWIQLKAFTVTSAFAVLLAFVGVACLTESRRRWLAALGVVGGLAVTGAVLYGNAVTYHDTTLAPGARYRDLAAIAARYAGRGPALDPYWDEYAEFFLRGAHGSSIVDPANFSFQVLSGVPLPPGGVSFAWDLNQLAPEFLQRFPLIIQPRSPTASRAPSNYDLIERTRYFEVWRRDRSPSAVLRHAPLSGLPHERTRHYCALITRWAREAGPSAQVAYAQGAATAAANLVAGTHPDYWKPRGPTALDTLGAGTAQTTVNVPLPGRYGVWLQGSVGRPITVYIDAHRLTSIGYEERYPSEYLLLSRATLGAGIHTVRVIRGNGSLHPGSGDPVRDPIGRELGLLVFQREESSSVRVHVAAAAKTAQVCSAPAGYQWLELLGPGAAPPDALPIG